MKRLILSLSVAALGLLGGAMAVAALRSPDAPEPSRGAATPFEGSVMPPKVPAPDFRLTDERGESVSMRRLRGRPVIVTFLYTNCKDTCPIEAQQIRGALDRLDEDIPALAIAVDPPRDTRESARRFLRKSGVLGRIRFVLGSRAELEPVWRGFFIREQAKEAEHSARVVLIDSRGYQRVGYPGTLGTPERIAHDVKVLLAEAK